MVQERLAYTLADPPYEVRLARGPEVRAVGAAAGEAAVSPLTQALRLARLLAHILRMWIGTLLIAPRLGIARRRRLVYRWAARLLATVEVEVRIRGAVPPGGRPVLLVANHVSWLDTYAIHTVSAARFVAKSEVATWPVIRTVAARFGTVFIKRGCFRSAARTVGILAEALGAGHAVAAFPEATTSDGRRLLRFYPAMFQAAVRSGARVQPVAIRYRRADGTPTTAAAYVGEMSVGDSLRRILREPRLVVDLIFCPPMESSGRTRRELAALARASIATALGLAAESKPDEPSRRAA